MRRIQTYLPRLILLIATSCLLATPSADQSSKKPGALTSLPPVARLDGSQQVIIRFTQNRQHKLTNDTLNPAFRFGQTMMKFFVMEKYVGLTG